jgi:hypothetical protein
MGIYYQNIHAFTPFHAFTILFQDVCKSCCVNPGRLAKGLVGGTYARVIVQPTNDPENIIEKIAAKVIKI